MLRSPTRLMLAVILVAATTGTLTAADPPDRSPLPGTEPLTMEGDIASQMVDGVDRFLLRKLEESVEKRATYWHRDFTSAEAYEKSIEPNRKRLAKMLGVVDERVSFDEPQLVGTTERPARIATGDLFNIHAVRWPVLTHPRRDIGAVAIHGEGLLLQPTGESKGDIVVIPHCDDTPEHVAGLMDDVKLNDRFAYLVADMGFRVIVPTLISRREALPNLTHREYLYRSAFELGRHLVGYEVQKVLACVDWFEKDAAAHGREAHIGVLGYRDGGMIALYAGALDTRIDATVVVGYCDKRERIWQQPIDRNVFGLLREFGDAELMSMIAPRGLSVAWAEYETQSFKGGRGAPAEDVPPDRQTAHEQWGRFRDLAGARFDDLPGAQRHPGMRFHPFHSMQWEVASLTRPDLEFKVRGPLSKKEIVAPLPDAEARHARLAQEIDLHNQALLGEAEVVRAAFMKRLYDAVPKGIEEYNEVATEYREVFRHEVIGHFDDERLPFNPRTRKDAETDKWTRHEVVLDVFPDVIAYGLLIVPKGIGENEKRPVVVCQHGLEGRPQDVIGEKGHQYYKAFATELAERGFITFAPQNLYIFTDRFRTLQRKANPLGKTLFSIIVPQHQQITDWLKTLPGVDGDRIAFYGLSYGGKSAMRIPPLVDNYCLSICSADFNEWVWKNASTATFAKRYTYANKGEYEIFEWDLGSAFNYAEMAALIAPRPFMVERGHDDGVAPDETVAYEYAKVRRLYAKLGIPDRTEIEFFNGPHAIHGVGTYRFLHKHLDWPGPGE